MLIASRPPTLFSSNIYPKHSELRVTKTTTLVHPLRTSGNLTAVALFMNLNLIASITALSSITPVAKNNCCAVESSSLLLCIIRLASCDCQQATTNLHAVLTHSARCMSGSPAPPLNNLLWQHCNISNAYGDTCFAKSTPKTHILHCRKSNTPRGHFRTGIPIRNFHHFGD